MKKIILLVICTFCAISSFSQMRGMSTFDITGFANNHTGFSSNYKYRVTGKYVIFYLPYKGANDYAVYVALQSLSSEFKDLVCYCPLIGDWFLVKKGYSSYDLDKLFELLWKYYINECRIANPGMFDIPQFIQQEQPQIIEDIYKLITPVQ